MATPTKFDSDMLRKMAEAVSACELRQSLLVSGGMLAQIKASSRANSPAISSNPIFDGYGYQQSYMGFPVEVHDIPPEQVFDWSACRSPSRARRRYKQGHPQRVKITYRERAFLFDKRVLIDWTNRFDRMAVQMMLGETK